MLTPTPAQVTPKNAVPRTVYGVLYGHDGTSPTCTAPVIDTSAIDRIECTTVHFRGGGSLWLSTRNAAALRRWLACPHLTLCADESMIQRRAPQVDAGWRTAALLLLTLIACYAAAGLCK